MASHLFTVHEALAILKSIGVSVAHIAAFKQKAERTLEKKPRVVLDNVTVASGYGTASRKGNVELSINETLTQMEPAKAREIGLHLLEAAEAAVSDEIFLKLLSDRVGITDPERLGMILLDLREIRQGSRGTVYPS